MAQCPRAQEATSSGGASVMGREQIRWATSVVVLLPPPRLLTVLVRRIRITWAAPGKSTRAGASTAWTVRRTLRPWEQSGTEVEGTSFQGSFSRARFRPGRHVLDREHVVGAAAADPLGCAGLGVHGVGAGDRTAQVQGGEQVPQRGYLVGLVGHPPLGQGRAGGPARGRQEVGGRVGAGAGPAHGLAVHGDHRSAPDGAGAGEEPGGRRGRRGRPGPGPSGPA